LPSLIVVSVFLYFSLTSPPQDSSSQPTPTPTPVPAVNLLFGGDLMFDRNIRQVAQEDGYAFILDGLTDYLDSFDLVIANLEGPITDQDSQSLGSETASTANFIFTFEPQVTDLFTTNNITLLNLGNNHILNFGEEGLQQTTNYLDQSNLLYFGDTGTDLVSPFLIQHFPGLDLAFINYNQFTDQGIQPTLNLISQLRSQVDLIIIYTHWGEEYQDEPSDVITDQAYQFIDQGADLIIGSHPHVVQTHEMYQGKNIYYSLGNFVFDQYFSTATQQGLLIELTIQKGTEGEINLSTKEVFIDLLSTGQTVLSRAVQELEPSSQEK